MRWQPEAYKVFMTRPASPVQLSHQDIINCETTGPQQNPSTVFVKSTVPTMAAHSRLLTGLCVHSGTKATLCWRRHDDEEERDISQRSVVFPHRWSQQLKGLIMLKMTLDEKQSQSCLSAAQRQRELLHPAWLDKHQPSRFINSLFFVKSHIFLFIFSSFSHLRALTCIQLQHKPGAQPGCLNKGAMWGPLNIQRRHNKTKSHKWISEMLLCCCYCKMTIWKPWLYESSRIANSCSSLSSFTGNIIIVWCAER